MTGLELLRRIDAYLDAVPRTLATTEDVGPFTLFVNRGGGWRYYARPRPGGTVFTSADVARVRARQRTLAQPEELEWVEDLSPGVGPAAERAGLRVATMPLMHLPERAFAPLAGPAGSSITFATPRDDLATIAAVATLAFGAPGTGVGAGGPEAVAEAAAAVEAETVGLTRARLARGLIVTAVATIGGEPVAVGSHQPLDGVSEIVGVGTLPALRRKGLGTALTSALARDAFARGVEVVFLSAGDETVARVYSRVGFHTIGRVGAAAPA
ncbi:MAG: GNAT family N-acetyltransferase [Actinomycetota bacterium]